MLQQPFVGVGIFCSCWLHMITALHNHLNQGLDGSPTFVLRDSGFAGWWDNLMGPGVRSPSEMLAICMGIFGAAAAVPLLQFVAGRATDWGVLQYAMCAYIAGDICGGAVVLSTGVSKRYRQSHSFWERFGFTVFHLEPVFIACLYSTGISLTDWQHVLSLGFFSRIHWVYLLFCYGVLVVGTVGLLRCPVYLQRPAAALLVMFASIIDASGLVDTPCGWEWFVSVFTLKVLLCNLVTETPFRPGDSSPRSPAFVHERQRCKQAI